MTRYLIKRRSDGWYVTRYGFSDSARNAKSYELMTEAEIAILSNGLSECDVVQVNEDERTR